MIVFVFDRFENIVGKEDAGHQRFLLGPQYSKNSYSSGMLKYGNGLKNVADFKPVQGD